MSEEIKETVQNNIDENKLMESLILKEKENISDESLKSEQVDSVQDKRKLFYTKKICKFCKKQLDENNINYKNVDLLKKFTMASGKILPRRISGNCAFHQKKLAKEIKKARIIALLPYVDR